MHGPLLCLSVLVFSPFIQSAENCVFSFLGKAFRPVFPIIDHLASARASVVDDRRDRRFQSLNGESNYAASQEACQPAPAGGLGCLSAVHPSVRPSASVSHGKLKPRMSIDAVVKRFFYVYTVNAVVEQRGGTGCGKKLHECTQPSARRNLSTYWCASTGEDAIDRLRAAAAGKAKTLRRE